ncbi:MAG: hypothetical protein DRI46_14265 [Chloroflexi bacterium]|nr:MAG: hypothetical protein DRI46_14265 [Chloroflexota bacterium]
MIWLLMQLSSSKELGNVGRLVIWLLWQLSSSKELDKVGTIINWLLLQLRVVSETKYCRPSRSEILDELTFINVSAITSGCVSSRTFPLMAFGTISCNLLTNAVSGIVYCAFNIEKQQEITAKAKSFFIWGNDRFV